MWCPVLTEQKTFRLNVQNGSTRMMIDDRWISQVDLTLVAIFGRLVEETGEKNGTFCELGSFHRVSVSVKSQLFKDFKDQASRSSHPCTGHCSGISIQRFPQVIQVFLLLWGCSSLCSWSCSTSLAAARAGGAGSPLNFLFLIIKAASPHNQCSQYHIHNSQIECLLDSDGSWNNFLMCSEWKNLFNYIWNQPS